MSLFGAATSGVDPQTGSYLSKKQRIAMFRASQGRGGYGGGSSSGGEDNKPKVDPSSAIVVANKMTGIVQSLQTFTQENVNAVSQQVQANRQSIENLYNDVAADREAEAKLEAAETKQKRFNLDKFLKKGREGLIEGISSAVSGTVNAVQRGLAAATRPFQGLFQKLFQALGLLAGAWAIDNIDTILDMLENFSLEELGGQFVEQLTNVRGTWSLLDRIFAGVKTGIRRAAGAAFRLARFIVTKTYSIGKKIVTTIGNFVIGIAKRVVGGLYDIAKRAATSIWDGLKGAAGGGKGVTGALSNADDIVDAGSDAAKNLPPARKGFFSTIMDGISAAGTKITDFGRGIVDRGSKLLDQAGTSISSGLESMSRNATGVEVQDEAARKGWIQRALQPLIKKFPALKSGIGKVLGFANKLFKIPGIGFAIDLALNKGVEGQDWTEAIIRAAGSSIGGGFGAAAGIKLGGAAGATVGALAGGVGAIPGAAIGAALGGILGSMLGGAGGDLLGKGVTEFVTGKPAMDNEVLGQGAIESVLGMNGTNSELEAPSSEEHTEKETPDFTISSADYSKMSESLDASFLTTPTGGNFDFVELPPIMRDMRTPKQNEGPQETVAESGNAAYSSFDPDMQSYKNFSQLAYQVT